MGFFMHPLSTAQNGDSNRETNPTKASSSNDQGQIHETRVLLGPFNHESVMYLFGRQGCPRITTTCVRDSPVKNSSKRSIAVAVPGRTIRRALFFGLRLTQSPPG